MSQSLFEKSPSAVGPLGAADRVEPLLDWFFADQIPLRFEFWDGTAIGPESALGTVAVRSANALRRLIWAPTELGLARAYVAGDLDLEGDVFEMLAALDSTMTDRKIFPGGLIAAIAAGRAVGALAPLRVPAEEARVRGRRHTKRHDARAISHHYDVGNDFYELVLGPSMVYSCARFATPTFTLEQAQHAKIDFICRKLGLQESSSKRLLDIGCGWGSLVIHAARHYDAQAVGVTLSSAQAELASQRVAAAGVADRVEIRLRDYRDLRSETFDAVSSVGMFEHVGAQQMTEYFSLLKSLVAPRGRLLNHAISAVNGSRMGRHSFIGRYVFPDGELMDVGQVLLAMEAQGFEIRDVESLREHYAQTLRHWVKNLETSWDEAVRLVGVRRARIWRLYMAGSALNFERGGISIHQVLGIVPSGGESGMPATRDAWVSTGSDIPAGNLSK